MAPLRRLHIDGGCDLQSASAASPKSATFTPEHIAEKIRASRLEGERKHVTVLFADVTGSMELAETLDPEDWRRLMERYFQILCDGLHRFEGTVDKFTGARYVAAGRNTSVPGLLKIALAGA